MKLRHRTTADVQFEDDDWDIAGKDYEDELREAIATAREDHDAEIVVEPDDIYLFKVRWNENTDSVWVSVFGYSLGLEVDEEATDLTEWSE
jgi:hypothetical protein